MVDHWLYTYSSRARLFYWQAALELIHFRHFFNRCIQVPSHSQHVMLFSLFTSSNFIQCWLTLKNNNNNWMAPRKLAPSDKFVAFFQVAQNPLKFPVQTLFLWKNVPVVFFHKRGNKVSSTLLKVHPPYPPPSPPLPPPPSPSNRVQHTCTVFWLSRIKILHCLETDREVVWIFTQFCPYFSAFLKNKHKDIF